MTRSRRTRKSRARNLGRDAFQGEAPAWRSGPDQWGHRDRRETGDSSGEVPGCFEGYRYRSQSKDARAFGSLGADETIALDQPEENLLRSFKAALAQVQVVLDYLWGPSAELMLKAAVGHGAPDGEPRIRFVQIGSISGDAIKLSGGSLRSSGVELLGSGLGSLSSQQILQSLRAMFAATEKFHLQST